jgi:hypothetical protein
VVVVVVDQFHERDQGASFSPSLSVSRPIFRLPCMTEDKLLGLQALTGHVNREHFALFEKLSYSSVTILTPDDSIQHERYFPMSRREDVWIGSRKVLEHGLRSCFHDGCPETWEDVLKGLEGGKCKEEVSGEYLAKLQSCPVIRTDLKLIDD